MFLVQGIGAPFQKDAEPQSAEWIISVAHDGHWLFPRDYYGFVDRKPPLYYWLSAIAARSGGGTVDEGRARIVSVLSATVIAVEVLVWTVSEIGLAQGCLAFLFILGIYGFSSRATLALTDMLMVALLMSAWLVIYPMFAGRVVSRSRVVAAGLLLGFGIITKGPVVLVLVALAITIFAILGGDGLRATCSSAWAWRVVLIGVAVGACWYLPWLLVGGRRELEIFLNENLGHFAPTGLGGTGEASRPFWYPTARLIGGANPLILLVPATLAGFATGEVSAPQRRPLLFQASLVAAVIVFFSLANAKRDDYILPALPGVAILSAAAFGMKEPARGFAGGARIRDGVCGLIAFATLLAVALALVTARKSPDLSLQSSDAALMTILERGIGARSAPFMLLLAVSALAAVGAFVLLFRGSIGLVGAMIGVISLAGVTLMDAVVRPELAWARSYKSFVAEIRGRIDGHPLFVMHDADFELAFYYGGAVPPLVYGKRLPPVYGGRPPAPPPDASFYLLARDSELAMLPESYRDRLRAIARSSLTGREGSPVLYLIEPLKLGLNTGWGTAR
jgi:4-amino-4-deoxy-L-arabinose transferase-like glycosyltransferase